MFEVPILILAFNRVDTTQKVFDNIKGLKPKKLFVGVDGPRSGKEGERQKCLAVQNIFLTQVDWDCELKTLFRDENMGCRDAVNEAITWFFDNVDEGIILEDDCIPNESFFQFCEDLLEKYRQDNRVMHISGYKPHGMNINLSYSYFFSRQTIVWGWASWSRAWKKMDVHMKDFPIYKENKRITKFTDSTGIQRYMMEKWEETYLKLNSSWAYAWSFCIENLNGLTIVPNQNMIHNIGYGEDATNTKNDDLNRGKNYSSAMTFPLTHPRHYDELGQKEKRTLEKEIFYKIQKSHIGVLIRNYVPRSILELAKWILGKKK